MTEHLIPSSGFWRTVPVFDATPTITCPRPELTHAQARRVLLHRARTEQRRTNPRAMQDCSEPHFDAEPSMRCGKAGCDAPAL